MRRHELPQITRLDVVREVEATTSSQQSHFDGPFLTSWEHAGRTRLSCLTGLIDGGEQTLHPSSCLLILAISCFIVLLAMGGVLFVVDVGIS